MLKRPARDLFFKLGFSIFADLDEVGRVKLDGATKALNDPVPINLVAFGRFFLGLGKVLNDRGIGEKPRALLIGVRVASLFGGLCRVEMFRVLFAELTLLVRETIRGLPVFRLSH